MANISDHKTVKFELNCHDQRWDSGTLRSSMSVLRSRICTTTTTGWYGRGLTRKETRARQTRTHASIPVPILVECFSVAFFFVIFCERNFAPERRDVSFHP